LNVEGGYYSKRIWLISFLTRPIMPNGGYNDNNDNDNEVLKMVFKHTHTHKPQMG
jgi:hypothetical protein